MLATLALALAPLTPVQEPRPIPDDLAADCTRSERIGRALFESDQAAWHGSDALAESKGPLEKLGLGGFLALKMGETGWTVLFLSHEDPPRIVQRVQVQAVGTKPKVLDTPAPLPLSKEDVPLWDARKLAIESGGEYEQPINPVVLRGSDFGERGILVYLLGGTEKPDVAVLGRHVRVRVSEDGTKAIEVLPLVKGVIESPTKTKDGKTVAALMATQIVTDFPSEVQVFAQLNAGLPLFVGTRRGLWRVEQGKIAFLGEKPPQKATLELRLRDRVSGEACAGKVCLWRVETPADAEWTAGDERLGIFEVPKDGLSIPDLQPGRYRALCDAHSCGQPEPEAFDVKAPNSSRALEVVAPRARPLTLDLVDERGVPFGSAEYDRGSRAGKERTPDWVRPRKRITPAGPQPGNSIRDAYNACSTERGIQLARGQHGFELGALIEDGKLYSSQKAFELRVAGHDPFKGALRCDAPEEPRYRAVLLDRSRFAGLFTLPDGKPLDPLQLEVRCALVPDLDPRPAQWWLDAPITVTARPFGCEPLELEFRLRDGLPKPRRLEKSP